MPATVGAMTQPPPIIPGQSDPYEQQPYQPPQQYPPQPPPVPVYQVGGSRSDIVGKTAISTVVVVATLIIVFCVAPLFFCVACGALGSVAPTN